MTKYKAKYPHGIFVLTGPNAAYFSKGVVFYGETFEAVDDQKAETYVGKLSGWLLVNTKSLGLGWVSTLLIEKVEE